MKDKLKLAVKIFFILAICLFFVNTDAVQAQSMTGKEYEIGVSGGFWLSGDIDVEGVTLDKENSFMLRAFVDSYLMPKFAVGLYGNYSDFEVSYGNLSGDVTMYEIGVTLKPKFMLGPTTAIKPGLNIGYRKLDPDYDLKEVEGMGLNLSVEIQFLLGNGLIFYVEPGFLSQPNGGNEDADVTWAPIWYLVAGVAF